MLTNTPTDNIEKKTLVFLRGLRNLSQFIHCAQVGRELLDLMDSYDSLMAHHTIDGDEPQVSVTAARAQEQKVATRRDILTALQAVTGHEKRKKCRVCGQDKVLSAFSVRNDKRDGRNKACKKCESARVKLYDDRKRVEQGRKTEAARKAAEAVRSRP